MRTAGTAGVGIVAAGAAGCATEASQAPPKPTQVFGGSSPHLPDDRGYAYFGEPNKKPAQKHYHKFMNTPATVIDYGLTEEQEERARELHSTLHIFDSEFEVSYYDGLLDNMLSGGAACVGGSHTIGALCFELHNGRAKPEERSPHYQGAEQRPASPGAVYPVNHGRQAN